LEYAHRKKYPISITVGEVVIAYVGWKKKIEEHTKKSEKPMSIALIVAMVMAISGHMIPYELGFGDGMKASA